MLFCTENSNTSTMMNVFEYELPDFSECRHISEILVAIKDKFDFDFQWSDQTDFHRETHGEHLMYCAHVLINLGVTENVAIAAGISHDIGKLLVKPNGSSMVCRAEKDHPIYGKVVAYPGHAAEGARHLLEHRSFYQPLFELTEDQFELVVSLTNQHMGCVHSKWDHNNPLFNWMQTINSWTCDLEMLQLLSYADRLSAKNETKSLERSIYTPVDLERPFHATTCPNPMISIGGQIDSGKSSMAIRIRDELNLPIQLIDRDDVMAHITQSEFERVGSHKQVVYILKSAPKKLCSELVNLDTLFPEENLNNYPMSYYLTHKLYKIWKLSEDVNKEIARLIDDSLNCGRTPVLSSLMCSNSQHMDSIFKYMKHLPPHINIMMCRDGDITEEEAHSRGMTLKKARGMFVPYRMRTIPEAEESHSDVTVPCIGGKWGRLPLVRLPMTITSDLSKLQNVLKNIANQQFISLPKLKLDNVRLRSDDTAREIYKFTGMFPTLQIKSSKDVRSLMLPMTNSGFTIKTDKVLTSSVCLGYSEPKFRAFHYLIHYEARDSWWFFDINSEHEWKRRIPQLISGAMPTLNMWVLDQENVVSPTSSYFNTRQGQLVRDIEKGVDKPCFLSAKKDGMLFKVWFLPKTHPVVGKLQSMEVTDFYNRAMMDWNEKEDRPYFMWIGSRTAIRNKEVIHHFFRGVQHDWRVSDVSDIMDTLYLFSHDVMSTKGGDMLTGCFEAIGKRDNKGIATYCGPFCRFLGARVWSDRLFDAGRWHPHWEMSGISERYMVKEPLWWKFESSDKLLDAAKEMWNRLLSGYNHVESDSWVDEPFEDAELFVAQIGDQHIKIKTTVYLNAHKPWKCNNEKILKTVADAGNAIKYYPFLQKVKDVKETDWGKIMIDMKTGFEVWKDGLTDDTWPTVTRGATVKKITAEKSLIAMFAKHHMVLPEQLEFLKGKLIQWLVVGKVCEPKISYKDLY
jgi:hypothetical protein